MGTITDSNIIEVDFGADPRAKYIVLEGAVRAAIDRGDLPPGTRLPPVRDLAWKIGVTPGTVARAYSRLTEAGVLTAEVGRGTYVAEPSAPAPIYAEFQAPLEVDAVAHGTGGDNWAVNMLSPHLPSVGQGALIRRLMGEIAQDPPSGLMHYPHFAGERPAREAAAAFLAHPMLGPVAPDDITLSHGGQQAIALVLQTVLRGRRPAVLLEELAYPGFRRMAEVLRADVIDVAIDDQGVVPEALLAAARGADAQILCVSPDVQNPTCTEMPLARREALVAAARSADIQILEDDCYRMGEATLPSLRSLAPERVWHVSSIAKTITPALRLGFALAPPGRQLSLRRAAEYNSFGLATPISDLAARLLIHPDLPGLMDELRATVGRYIADAREILDGHALTARDDVSFLWLQLPRGWRASSFCRAAEEIGVKLRAAEEYASREANAPHAVRFAVNTGVTPESWRAALTRLRGLLDHPPEGLGV
ncbi:PLP-dependent aminotransferase family protein [Jannaschia seohaensis]|uniref:DNA-binding transcriptional MocR family regulator n=1 Tax=Jannaschia seohaensis TaxID=475081 RepID=A0A2Y9B2G3_9RHOB|nr:PLP-dependent aminotransferase family protein [Jannaschia seohaensis]PWJ13310.1 DNA-binding transcriptional MocR family regulator [Jannaschia seohaensis]SSA50636.1 DNA-binding transcriptional regulator, MocR family, contains an aminotransferase domain [Jannaschia seohaensis]